MDEQIEISKLIRNLFIPIDNIVNKGDYMEIFSQNVHIGNLPYYNVSGILTYDTDINIVNNLKWQPIFVQNEEFIKRKVEESFGSDIQITLGTFRRLYIKDSDGNIIASVECRFENNEWRIIIE